MTEYLTEQELSQRYPGEWQRRFDTGVEGRCAYCPAESPLRTYTGAYGHLIHVHRRSRILPWDHILVSSIFRTEVAPDVVVIDAEPPA